VQPFTKTVVREEPNELSEIGDAIPQQRLISAKLVEDATLLGESERHRIEDDTRERIEREAVQAEVLAVDGKRRRNLCTGAVVALLAIVGTVIGAIIGLTGGGSDEEPEDSTGGGSDNEPSLSSGTFVTTEQLYAAVDAYMRNPSEDSDVALKYGYPMEKWDVSRVKDFSRLFDPLRESAFNPDRLFADSNFNENINGWGTRV
jgi:hypothetical protein